MRGGGGDGALGHVRDAVGCIECCQHGVGFVAHHFQIHRAPYRAGAVFARTTGFQIQFTGCRQQAVAHLLGVHALHGGAGKPGVGRIGLLGGGMIGILPVRGTGDHQPVQVLEAPAFGDQPSGEPIEQFGMRGRRAEFAKIAGVGGQPAAEMLLPHAVDHHARGEGVVGARNPIGQSRAAAGGLQSGRRRSDDRVAGIQQREEARLHHGVPLGNAGDRRHRTGITHHKFHGRQRLRPVSLKLFELCVQLFPLRLGDVLEALG